MLTLLFALRLLTAEILDNAAIVKMVSAGLGPDVITLKIERSQGAFDTSTDALIALKKAHVPDAIISAMLMHTAPVTAAPALQKIQAPVPATPAPREISVPPAAPPQPGRPSELCANAKFFSVGNDGPAWIPSTVCVGANGITIDEQTVAFVEVVAQCTVKAPLLSLGGTLLHGEQEWWLGDKQETLKFRGKGEDLDRLAAAVMHERGDLPRGGCGDREVRRRLVNP